MGFNSGFKGLNFICLTFLCVILYILSADCLFSQVISRESDEKFGKKAKAHKTEFGLFRYRMLSEEQCCL